MVAPAVPLATDCGSCMNAPAKFKYFANPRAPVVTTWQEEPRACDVCGRTGPGYAGPFYGPDACDFLCEACLGEGRLVALRASTNEGDAAALMEQLAALPEAERAQLMRARNEELAHRTPHLVTWQDFSWPACCGDYARFEGEVGRAELDRLAPDGDGWRWLQEHAIDAPLPFEADELPPYASRPGKEWTMAVYHFRCLSCGRALFHWDCD